MTIYPTIGSSKTWTGNGASNEARCLEVLQLPSGPTQVNQQVAIPLKLSLLSETTKRGVRRVALKIEGKLGGEWSISGPSGHQTAAAPLYQSSKAFVTGEIPVSVHLVAQMPQGVVQLEQGQTGASALMMTMIRELVAVATGASVTSTQAAAMDSLNSGVIISALAGSSVLDVISGSYGEASRS